MKPFLAPRLIAIFICLVITSCKIFNEKTDKDDLIGDVKQVTTSQFETIEINSNVDKGKITSENVSTFDDKNNVVENKLQFLDGSGRVITDNYKHDDKGNIIEDLIYDSYFKNTNKKVYNYDDKNNVLNEIEFDSLNKEDYRQNYINKYDNQNNLIERTSKDMNRSITTSYKYDEKGNSIEED